MMISTVFYLMPIFIFAIVI